MRAADACHIGIQFPLLNMAFVEVHGAKWSQGHGYKEQAREEGREVRTTVARRGSQKDRRLRATNADSSPRRASSHGISVPQRGTRRLGQHGSKTTKSGGYRRNRNRAAAWRTVQIIWQGKGDTSDDTQSCPRITRAIASGNFCSPIDHRSLQQATRDRSPCGNEVPRITRGGKVAEIVVQGATGQGAQDGEIHRKTPQDTWIKKWHN